MLVLYIGKMAFFTARAANACSRRNGIDSWTRIDTTSCQFPATLLKKNPMHWARHGPSMWQYMNNETHEMLKKARKRGYKNILDRWNNDKYSISLSDIGWTEEQIIQYDEIALEDHSNVATKQEGSRKEKSLKLSLNAEGIQGPLKQRCDFKEAKQTCKRLYHEYTAITGSGNKPILPERQVRQRRDQQCEGLEEYNYRLEASTGWRYYPSSTTHSSSSPRGQPSSDLWSTWSWESWKSSSWTEQ